MIHVRAYTRKVKVDIKLTNVGNSTQVFTHFFSQFVFSSSFPHSLSFSLFLVFCLLYSSLSFLLIIDSINERILLFHLFACKRRMLKEFSMICSVFDGRPKWKEMPQCIHSSSVYSSVSYALWEELCIFSINKQVRSLIVLLLTNWFG